MKELVATESSYLADLLVLSTVFLSSLFSQGIINAQEVKKIFANVEQLISLSKRLSRVLSEESRKDSAEQDFGSIFSSAAEELLDVYVIYCSNLSHSRHVVNYLQHSRPQFAQYLQQASSQPSARGESIKSFLIMPLQRLCKYPLLLKELIKYSPNPASLGSLKSASGTVQHVLNDVNEKMVFSETLGPLMKLEDMFSEVSNSLESQKGGWEVLIDHGIAPHRSGEATSHHH